MLDLDIGYNYRFEVIELSDSDVADQERDFNGLDSATVDQSISMDHLRTQLGNEKPVSALQRLVRSDLSNQHRLATRQGKNITVSKNSEAQRFNSYTQS